MRETCLADEVECYHVAGLCGDGVWGELELVVGSDGDGHYGCGCGSSREEEVGEQHVEEEEVKIMNNY
jgi:hypothetical protein